MAQSHILVGASERTATDPVVRRIVPADLMDALKKGYDDFVAMPSHAIFLCVVYPVIGILAGRPDLGLFARCRCCFRWRPGLRSSAPLPRLASMN